MNRLGLIAALLALPAAVAAQDMRNRFCKMHALPDGSIEVTAAGTTSTRTFRPAFMILSRQDDPKFELKKEPTTAYAIPTWGLANNSRTFDLFDAAESVTTTASKSERKDGKVYWHFPD